MSIILASSILIQAGVFIVVAFLAFSAIFYIGEKVFPFRFDDPTGNLMFLLSIVIIVTFSAVLLVSLT